ncbi:MULTISPECIES: MBL fold metallo-hydrolase [Streptomyces violaceoruber group]|uniref:MBL fold metallo-hydrolase n=1 Tax=Streptomyces violaceoruber group TaxID=2867121 RepID=UPI001EF24345|nr:MBL fold metallo-hydrolase [Streptomyces rubrogriseus]
MGTERGAHPYADSVLVRGTAKNLVIDSSLSLVGTAPPAALVFVRHAHEDHVAGLADYEVPVCIHEKDLAALRSHEVMVNGYGLPPDATERTHAVPAPQPVRAPSRSSRALIALAVRLWVMWSRIS